MIAMIPTESKSVNNVETLKKSSESESVKERIGLRLECSMQHPAPTIIAKINAGKRNDPSERESMLEKGIIERTMPCISRVVA